MIGWQIYRGRIDDGGFAGVVERLICTDRRQRGVSIEGPYSNTNDSSTTSCRLLPTGTGWWGGIGFGIGLGGLEFALGSIG